MRTLLAFILLLIAPAGAQPRAVFQRVFTTITTAQSSAPVTNSGQTMHILTVFFPSQAVTTTGFQVRLEGSFDNSTFFPIMEDLTRAPLIGGQVYGIAAAFGPWPYVRVRSVNNPPAAMTVYYSGHTLPVVGFVAEKSDRFLL
jgi:hypothetical protein